MHQTGNNRILSFYPHLIIKQTPEALSFLSRFDHRNNQPELIDELTLSGDDLRRNLEELAFINQWLGGNQVTLSGLNKLLAGRSANPALEPHLPLRIADLGCGGGDMLVLMAQWASRKKLPVDLVGIDANAFILDYARHHTRSYPNITYVQQNIFADEFRQHTFDIVTCTLFCHHFEEESLIRLLTQLRQQTRLGIVINDLHRHWFAYHSISWLTRWFSRSYLVKNDARLSVWRAFRRRDLERMISAAGYIRYQIRWRWAFRWEVVIYC
jgi:2-polyprenyl-3-methyl-5-hydroxy-6-metoxy-1,4-benzoquinol methylase